MNNVHRDIIVLQTHTSTPDDYGGCDCAVLKLTAELAALVKSRIEIAIAAYRSDPMLWELCFSSPDPEFYDHVLVSACDDADGDFAANLQNTGRAHLPASVSVVDFEAARTECDEMVLRIISGSAEDVRTEIAWRVMPKNSETFVTTAPITIEWLDSKLAAIETHCEAV